ncbi:MAG: hypothetical protein DRP70_16525 [Spirochaetes bacterium]|nr:MAG: hypothetical protein DRP70_16525 [Spirochaetota bacterium]
MKKKQLIIVILGVLILSGFTSCNISLVKGSNLPAEYAIASGDTRLMLSCLGGLNSQLESGGLSDLERGEIALDMVDILAVLSNAFVTILPYLLDGEPLAPLVLIDDFIDEAGESYLTRIAEDRLMEYGINADPSPMQLFWGILGLAVYESVVNGGDYNSLSLSPDLKSSYDAMVLDAQLEAAEGSNPDFILLLNQLRTVFGEPI